MRVFKKGKTWKWHWKPYCVAEVVNRSGWIRGKNFLWLNWLFCFTEHRLKGEGSDSC